MTAYLVSSRTDALDDVDDILEAEAFVCAAGPVLVAYTDLAFLADSPASELLLPRALSDFREIPDLAAAAPPLPLLDLGDVCTALAGFSNPTEEQEEILRSLASDLHSISSACSFWQLSRSSTIIVDIFSISDRKDCCSRLE